MIIGGPVLYASPRSRASSGGIGICSRHCLTRSARGSVSPRSPLPLRFVLVGLAPMPYSVLQTAVPPQPQHLAILMQQL